MSSLAQHLGRWVSGLQLADVPVKLRDKARDHLLDTIGAAIAGDGRAPVRVAARAFVAPGETPLLVDEASRHTAAAARINAVAAHAAEIDDTEGCDHTGAVVVPTILALAREREGVTGDDFLAAMIAGYEVGRRVQNALGGYDVHNRIGWHSTATCGVFAAAAAAARVLRLDAAQCTSALAIAASSSAGTWAFADDGSMTKQLHVANAAGNGLEAALLARAGATGPSAIFDDVWGGYFTTHGTADARPGALVAELGERWHMAHSAIKMYAACRSAHPSIDGVVDELRHGGLQPQSVREVRIELSSFMRAMICPASPRTVESARMSLPVSIALLLLGESLEPDAYARFQAPDVADVLARFTIVETEELSTPQSVRVTLQTSETRYVIERERARGSGEEPFGTAQVQEKFRRLVEPRIGTARTQALIDHVRSLDAGPLPPLPRIWGP